jgi:homoserine kinase
LIQSSSSIKANQALLSSTKGARGVLEHEIGHAFGLKDTTRANTLMNGVVSSDGSDAGTSLSQDELRIIENSRLLSLATAADDARH